MAVKKGLGRGLDILIPKDNASNKKKEIKQKEKPFNSNDVLDVSENGSVYVDINKIEPNRNQPRKQFDEEGIKELADSIQKYGLIQPLIIQKKDDYYEIIAGERRWRASKKAGLKEVPAIIKEYNESDTLKVSLIENLQREDLNPIEEAQAYHVLKKEYHLKQEEIAASVSKSRTAITNTMRLLKLDERIQNLIMEDQLTSGHGRALLAITDKKLQYKTALYIRDNNLSVRESERLIKKLLSEKETAEKDYETDNAESNMYRFFEKQIAEIFGSKVVIKNRKNNKGRIEIDYYSQEELEKIIDMIQSIK